MRCDDRLPGFRHFPLLMKQRGTRYIFDGGIVLFVCYSDNVDPAFRFYKFGPSSHTLLSCSRSIRWKETSSGPGLFYEQALAFHRSRVF